MLTATKRISSEDQKDIRELEDKIGRFKSGQMHEERFRHYRLTRGVYGQRQEGVQMFRTKLPYGKVTADQLKVLADLADRYGHKNLHITTRQNIQLHYVKLENAPAVWKGLAAAGLTARGACGNTVRNVTASAAAGIDPDEPFDVTPYVHGVFEYFLRNAICQDMGRKIKIAFSSSEKDSGFTYFHDFGFIPRIREIDGKEVRGFKVVIGGGLGAVSIVAPTVSEFMPADEILTFTDAAIRVFDRYGEREKRMKARMKFLVKKLGVEKFLELVDEERKGVPAIAPFNAQPEVVPALPDMDIPQDVPIGDPAEFALWKKTNVFEQKQDGFFGVFVRVHLGDLDPATARTLADLVSVIAADDIRFTVDQSILLRFVREEALPYLYHQLTRLRLASGGYGSIADVVACPGTDTCALGVTNSTGLADTIRDMVEKEYPALLDVQDISIKISGCMNSCGQHMGSPIGFHGSSIRRGIKVIPAMQVVLGGGVDTATGEGFVAQKVIKVPTRRIPKVIQTLLADYQANKHSNEKYLIYFYRQGKRYFYDLLKGIAKTDEIVEYEFFDWGQDKQYIQSIGVGECAGVSYDMVGAILGDAVEKIEEAKGSLQTNAWSEAIYHGYTAMIIAAKGWLLSKDIKCNTHIGIIEDFDGIHSEDPAIELDGSFVDLVFQMKHNEPDQIFAEGYVQKAVEFVRSVIASREDELEGAEKLVVNSYYKA